MRKIKSKRDLKNAFRTHKRLVKMITKMQMDLLKVGLAVNEYARNNKITKEDL